MVQYREVVSGDLLDAAAKIAKQFLVPDHLGTQQ